MQKITSLLLFILFNNVSFSQNAKIEFSAPNNTIDYGVINKTDSGIRSIDFTNTGDVPLLVSNVLTTTGFMVLSIPSAPILPGKTNKVEIKYNMAVGPIRKTITIESNAANYDSGRIALKIKGEVIE